LFNLEIPPKKIVEKSNENIVKMTFNNIYDEETCEKNGHCSDGEETFVVPDQCKYQNSSFISNVLFVVSIKNENPSDWPGEMGEAYIPPSHLQSESQRRFSENMFDIVASDQIALDRSMPDIRNDQ
jgi:hypothetical protein